LEFNAVFVRVVVEIVSDGVDFVKDSVDSVRDGAVSENVNSGHLRFHAEFAIFKKECFKDRIDDVSVSVDLNEDGVDFVSDSVDFVKDGVDSVRVSAVFVKDGVDFTGFKPNADVVSFKQKKDLLNTMRFKSGHGEGAGVSNVVDYTLHLVLEKQVAV
jgi:hypothetical protein